MLNAADHSIESVLGALRTDGAGLTTSAAIRRRQRFGFNALPERRRPGVVAIAAEELKNPLLIILSIAATAAMVFGERLDGAFILVTLAVTAGFGIGMALRAEHALDALKNLLLPTAIAVRDGREVSLDVAELVPGDRIVLRRGMRVPADAIMLAGQSLEVDESMLTGESVPVVKGGGTSDTAHPSPRGRGEGEGKIYGPSTMSEGVGAVDGFMLWQGTLVVEGQGIAVVTATGRTTKLASIASSLTATRERTPLQEQLVQFARTIALAVSMVAIALFALGIAQGMDVGEMLAIAIAIAVAAVPEGLAVAVTAILAVGTVRLAKRHCLVRRIIAAETLGSVSIILTDKTGTLTEGRMRAVALRTYDGDVGEVAIEPGMTLSRDAGAVLTAVAVGTEVTIANPRARPHEWEFIGSSTEAALVGAAGIAEMDVLALRKAAGIVDRWPFSAERKYSATLIASRSSTADSHKQEHELILIGAPERIVAHGKLPEHVREELDVKGYEGFRVIGIAIARVPVHTERIAALGNPTAHAVLVGLFFIRDPLRESAARAVAAARVAGVRTIMVTGDHPATAKRIAEDVGLAAGEPVVLTGEEVDRMSDAALAERIVGVDVFARTTHVQKARLVNAWQARGEAVAVTGDGVNDAPALVTSDVGVAMGSGTDISREAADLVLLDDRYETIVAGIEGGRTMWDNIRKTANYLLIASFTEVLIVAASIVSGMPLLILPAQILWVNLLEDTLPAAALAFEPPEHGVMHERPRTRKEPLLNRESRWLVFGAGLAKDALFIATGFAVLRWTGDLDLTRTVVFGALAAESLLFVFSVRVLRQPVWRTRPWHNPMLLAALAIAFALLIAGLTLPALRPLLHTVPLPLWGWGIIIALSFFGLVSVELVKGAFRWQHAVYEKRM
ncbi:MAG: cation-transporting P-type ATPase [bacterium]|nr:cation-transporting P-type ATPase [bacterium]